jgi:DNA-binding NarL/FixJ family response regulator
MEVHIADYHKMLVAGIHSAIDASEFAIVTGISETLPDCRRALERQQPDVLLIELSQLALPDPNRPKYARDNFPYNGIDFCEEVRKKYPQIKIVALTGYYSWITIRRLRDMGVSGYVLNTSPLPDVLTAIKEVMDGKTYLCRKSVRLLHREVADCFFWVTVGEQQLLRLIGEGYTNKKSAEQLFLAHETIKTKRKLLKEKVVGKTTIEMLIKAMQMGLIWEDLLP